MSEDDPTPLRKLWDAATKAHGWSTRDVAERVQGRGHTVKRSNINRVVNARPLNSISLEVILALSDGLRLSPARVAIAAVESMGIPMPRGEDVSPAEAIMRDEALAPSTKDALLAILRDAEGRRPA